MPVFNDESHVSQAIASLLAQEHHDFRLFISDNASTDGTSEICRNLASSDERVIYQRTGENRGSVWNLNHVFSLGNSSFFMWAASDDLWHPRFISACLSTLEQDKDTVLVHSHQQYMTYDGTPVGAPLMGFHNRGETIRKRWATTIRCWPLHMAYYGLMRREVARRTRLTLLRDSSDFIFVAEMSLWGKIQQIPDVLFWKRLDPAGSERRSHDALWSLIAGKPAVAPPVRFARWNVLRECLRGARRAGIPPNEYRTLFAETLRAYVSPNTRYMEMDLKEFGRKVMGERLYARLKQMKANRQDE